jgi:hypothetical protein
MESTWFKLLNMELDSIDNIIPPSDELNEGERYIGDMSELDKKLFTLATMLEREANQNLLDSRYSAEKSQKVILSAKATECMIKSNTVGHILDVSIREELKEWSAHQIRLSPDFKVYAVDKPQNNFMRMFEL